MRRRWRLRAGLAIVVTAATVACDGEPAGFEMPMTSTSSGSGSATGGGTTTSEPEGLDKEGAQATFTSTTDLMKLVFAPTCAAEKNECHNNEDFPDLSTEGNVLNLVDLRCNLAVGDRHTIEGFCEDLGDEVELDGAFSARVGSIAIVVDAEDQFLRYELQLDQPLPQSYSGASFVFLRGGIAKPALGGGSSAEGSAGSKQLNVVAADDIPVPSQVRQGDENLDGEFGDGSGVTIKRGDARASYLVRRLLGESERVRMPLSSNADNPTEINRYLDADEMYALMSWINCMGPDDGPYSLIHYDCAANADNDGAW